MFAVDAQAWGGGRPSAPWDPRFERRAPTAIPADDIQPLAAQDAAGKRGAPAPAAAAAKGKGKPDSAAAAAAGCRITLAVEVNGDAAPPAAEAPAGRPASAAKSK